MLQHFGQHVYDLTHWFIRILLLDLRLTKYDVCLVLFCPRQNKSGMSGQYKIDGVQTHFLSALNQCIRRKDSSSYFVDPISGRLLFHCLCKISDET